MIKNTHLYAWVGISGLLFYGTLAMAETDKEKLEKTEEQVQALKEENDSLAKRVAKLEENAGQQKLLDPYSDMEFLEELVFGERENVQVIDVSTLSECVGLKRPGSTMPVKSVLVESAYVLGLESFAAGGQRLIKYFSGDDPSIKIQDSEPLDPGLECRVAIVERQLFSDAELKERGKSPEFKDTTKYRINEAYTELNFDGWNEENIRFGANLGYVREAGVQTASIALHVFPAYRRHSPGNLDLWRRLSGYVSVGAVFNSSGSNKEVESSIIGAGIGVELIRGVSLNYGTSLFDSEDKDGVDQSSKDKTVSVTLRSEFWAPLLGVK